MKKIASAVCLLIVISSISPSRALPPAKRIELQHYIADSAAANSSDTAYIPTGFYFLTDDEREGIRMKKRGSDDTYLLSKSAFASVEHIINTRLQKTNLKDGIFKELCITFDAKGTHDLEEGTGNELHPKIAVVIAGNLLFVVDNTTKIGTGVMYIAMNDYSDQEIKEVRKAIDEQR